MAETKPNKEFSIRAPFRMGGFSRPCVGEGATSSITAPSNPISTFYRSAIDSLYLSFQGALKIDYQKEFENKKYLAQSDDPFIRGHALVEFGKHLFEVKDKGGKGFAFILIDNSFKIQISKGNKKIPLAYVQITSDYLSHVGAAAALADLREIINEIGGVGNETISRADLCSDFSTTFDLSSLQSSDFISNCKKFTRYEEKPNFTGLSFGLGSPIAFRLYNKTVELLYNSRPHLLELWRKNGWDNITGVWRGEYELKREVLREFKINTVADLLENQIGLWRYLNEEWLRLPIPNLEDTHRERWLTHPFWVFLTNSFGEDVSHPLSERFNFCREPSDDRIFKNGISGIVSYMARGGLDDFERAIPRFIADARNYFEKVSRGTETFENYIGRKIAEKRLHYNKRPMGEGEDD